ncbi:Btz superfamily domain-containing protein [Histoplasma ohiense]|nr:Btz superfamily domain-containing protein [Histoplasma ohiense (nom. inval.)]
MMMLMKKGAILVKKTQHLGRRNYPQQTGGCRLLIVSGVMMLNRDANPRRLSDDSSEQQCRILRLC